MNYTFWLVASFRLWFLDLRGLAVNQIGRKGSWWGIFLKKLKLKFLTDCPDLRSSLFISAVEPSNYGRIEWELRSNVNLDLTCYIQKERWLRHAFSDSQLRKLHHSTMNYIINQSKISRNRLLEYNDTEVSATLFCSISMSFCFLCMQKKGKTEHCGPFMLWANMWTTG